MNKLHPSVNALIQPIIHDMTQIKMAQATNPLISKNNEPEHIKIYKRKCVHIVFDGKEYQTDVYRNKNNELVCAACGHKINSTFGKEELETLNKALEIIDQIVLFGIVKGLRQEPLQTLINIKTALPAAATLMNELSIYVNEEDKASSNMVNIGSEYADPNAFGRITNI